MKLSGFLVGYTWEGLRCTHSVIFDCDKLPSVADLKRYDTFGFQSIVGGNFAVYSHPERKIKGLLYRQMEPDDSYTVGDVTEEDFEVHYEFDS